MELPLFPKYMKRFYELQFRAWFILMNFSFPGLLFFEDNDYMYVRVGWPLQNTYSNIQILEIKREKKEF